MESEPPAKQVVENAPWWRLQGIPILSGIITATAVMLLVYQLDLSGAAAHREQVHGTVVRDLAAVRGAAEVAINRRVHLLIALRAHVAIDPEMTRQQFADLSQIIIGEVDGIRSVTSIRDNTINDVYPRMGNEGAIGLNLLAHPAQRSAALHAIQTGKPWLAGPIKLVQGGEAFIYRAPVYRHANISAAPSRPQASSDYWGMVSLLIDKEALVTEILASVPDELEIAIYRPAIGETPRAPIAGDPGIVDHQSVKTMITLPTGRWELYGVPKQGWPDDAPGAMPRKVAGMSMAIILGVLVFSVTGAAARDRQSAARLRIASREAEAARLQAESANARLAREADAISRYATLLEQAHYESAKIMQDLEKTQSELSDSNVALKRSNEELEQFAYVASHDLQEPLRKVAAFCQLLELEYGDQLGGEGKRYLDYVVDGAHRMRNLIRDLLTFSKIQSEGEILRPVDSGRAVREAIRSLEGSIEERQAEIQIGPMPIVLGDLRLLTQLVQNLISNGIKYNQSSNPTIDIIAQRDGSQWVFTVRDNGIGIDPKDHDRVFGIFKRLHPKSDYAGTGIGLAICRRITERLGGQIGIHPPEAEPSGTCFFFTANAAEDDAEVTESGCLAIPAPTMVNHATAASNASAGTV